MEAKLESILQKVKSLCEQNPEFKENLLSDFITSQAVTVSTKGNRIDHIYEYCIAEVLRRQAHDFYKGFPLADIIPQLEEDFIRMESFRRQDNFGDFCLALYQQIEAITNKLCCDSDFGSVVDSMWGQSAYVNADQKSLGNRKESDYSIAKLIFLKKYDEKHKIALQNQSAMDKMRIVVYYLGYKALMVNSDYNPYKDFTDSLSDIYSCRNLNHRGNVPTDWEKEKMDRILPMKSLNYFKYIGILAQYVEYVRNNLSYIADLKKFADTCEKKKVIIGPKTVDITDEQRALVQRNLQIGSKKH